MSEAARILTAQRIAALKTLPAVKRGPSWLGHVATAFNSDLDLPMDRATVLLVARMHANGALAGLTPEEKAVRVAELRDTAKAASAARPVVRS